MRLDKISKANLADFDVNEINELLRELRTCETVVSVVDVEKGSKLDKLAGKLCRAANGDYFNLVYCPIIISDKELELIIKDTEEVWKLLNKNEEKTPFIKTIIVQDSILNRNYDDDSPDGVKISTPHYSISKYSMKNFSSHEEYNSVSRKMDKSASNESFRDFSKILFSTMDLNEINGLLSLFEVDEKIEEIVDLDFNDVEIDFDPDCYIGTNKDGEYIIVKLIVDEPNEKLYNELGKTCFAIEQILRKNGNDNPLLKPIVIDMGVNLRNNPNINWD